MKNQKLPPVGTKVWDAVKYPGLDGKIKEHGNITDKFPLRVKFKGIDEMVSYTAEGKYNTVSPIQQLSATPYDLIKGGFTPISEWNKPKVGDIGYFWDEEDAYLNFGILTEISERFIGFEANNDIRWDNFSPTIPEWYTEKLNEIKANLASPCTPKQKEK